MSRSALWLRFISQLKIRARDRRIIPLNFNDPQKYVWAKIAEKIDHLEPIRLIILKARREGLSTLAESLLLTYVASGDNVNALVTAHQKRPATKLWGMSKLFVTSSPLLSKMATIGANSIAIGRSVLEVTTAGSPDSERGNDLTAWHSSETSRYADPEILTATLSCLPESDDIFSIGILESTANGKVGDGAMFYEEWLRAEQGDSDWMPIFLPFFAFNEYQLPGMAIEEPDAEEYELRQQFELTDAQLAWRRRKIANDLKGDIDLFHQEFPVTADQAFIASGLPFFRPEHLLPLEKNIRKGTRGYLDPNGAFTRDPKGWLEVFVWPESGHTYVVGADSSMGIDDRKRGSDAEDSKHSRSAAEVIDMETMEQVAEYDAVSPPHLFARHLAGIGRLYNTALLAPEVQSSGGGGGRELIVYLRDLEYWNLHKWSHPDRVQRTTGTLYGWETNSRTRPRMLSRIREVIMEKSATIHSRRLLTQLGDFGESEAHDNHMEALSGHDDLLFAYGIALVSRSENYYKVPAQEPVMAQPDWTALGIHVQRGPESVTDRLARLMATSDQPNRGFLEL